MKVDVDYEMALNAIDKLNNNENLTGKEREILVEILKAVQGDYIPTREEIEQHLALMDMFNRIDIDKHTNTWNFVYDKITEYENKYC